MHVVRAVICGVALSLASPVDANAQAKPIGVLFAVGDIAECPNPKDAPPKTPEAQAKLDARTGKATADLINRQMKKVKDQYPDMEIRVLALGDLAYDCGATSAFNCFDKTWGQFKSIILPVPGNHEYDHKKGNAPGDKCVLKGEPKLKAQWHAKPYFAYFSYHELAKHEQSFYSLRFPNQDKDAWLLVGLNLNISFNPDTLKALLSKDEHKNTRCVLAFAHANLYSSGYHGHNDSKEPTALLVRAKADSRLAKAFDTLYNARASVMVAGHEHSYEQLGPANARGAIADLGASAMVEDGVRSFIVGTGGTNFYPYPYNHVWKFQEAYDFKNHGVLKIELYPTSYKWSFITIGDELKYPGGADCNPRP